MGRKRRKVIRRIKPKLPTKIFGCPKCYSEGTFRVKIDKASEIVKGNCSKCAIWFEAPFIKTNKGKATVHQAIDYYNFFVDSLNEG